MATSSDFLEYVLDQLSEWEHVYQKRMFSEIGLFRDDLMFGLVSNDSVYLKIDHTNKNKFIEAGSGPLKIFKSKSTVPSFYELPVHILEDAEEFISWAKESLEIQIKNNSPK